jgi:hypothetical protein
MEENQDILLLGNGINYPIDKRNEVSWVRLLEKLNEKFADEKVAKEGDKPFPLYFDEVLAYALKRNSTKNNFADTNKQIGEEIQTILKTIKRTNHYNLLANCPYDTILTTNYDYLLENVMDKEWKRKGQKNKETKYSLFRKQRAGNKTIWHIHGERDSRSSILLGYRHYIDYAARIKYYFIEVRKRQKQGQDEPKETWLKFFLSNDIVIAGLGMSYTEYPIWWLLAHRHYLLNSAKQEKPTNTISYVQYREHSLDSAKYQLLKAYGVNVKTIETNSSEVFYKNVLTNKLEDMNGFTEIYD